MYHPTRLDQCWWEISFIKIGLGESSRSPTAGELISLKEITFKIVIYVNLLESLSPYLDPEEPEQYDHA